MLRTNSKKAKENIHNYIIENFDASNFIDTPEYKNPETFHDIAFFIFNIFKREKFRNSGAEQKLFEEWAKGLPSVLDTWYYYNRNSLDDLTSILELTKKERNKYTRTQADSLLTFLIYREIKKETI